MKKLYYVIASLGLVLSLYLITTGHKIAGSSGLLIMLAGLGGLLLNLYCYNQRHR